MNIKKYLPFLAIIGIFIIVAIGLFPEVFNGKVVQQPDMLNFKGIGSDTRAYNKASGETAVWTGSSFSGMPTFIWGGAPYSGNKLKPLQNYLLSLGLPFPTGRFLIAFISFFILMLVLGINPWLGLMGSLAFGLSTYNFLISEAGHTSKFLAIIYFPVITAGTLLVYRGKYMLGSVLFGLGLGLDIMAGHIQMTYYLAICLGVYVLIKFGEATKKGTIKQFATASAILFIPLLLALGANASRLWTSYEYMQETIRGPQILETAAGNTKSGLSKDYVFDWSHGIGESISFIIPGAYGGGSVEKINKDYATYQDLRKKGVNPGALKTAPLYWGAMPYTSGPIYFGAIVWFLFILGILVVKGPVKWWLLGSTILIVLLSYGKNLMWFNDLFYNYFPLYDKFRSVNSILAVLQLTLPFLGVLALSKITSEKIDKEAVLKKLYLALGITGGFVVLFGLLGSGFLDFTGLKDVQLREAGYNLDALIEDRKMLLRKDAFRSLIYILIAAGLIWMYLKDKIKSGTQTSIMFVALSALMLLDLGGVGKRYLNSENFVNASRYQNNFKPRAVDKQILQDKDPNYRVLDLSINTFNSNRSSNYHKTIGGYHAAKLRRYADLIEKHVSRGNQKVLDMLNTRYVITQDQQAQRNPGALGNAWFVSNIKMVNSPDEEINALGGTDFNPKQTAVIQNTFQDYLGNLTTTSAQGTIRLTEGKPNHMTYESNAPAEQLAVFSEVIYKPNKNGGWKSYIDGKEVDHIRANYVLRAMKIPAGKHTIEFKFMPTSYYTGEVIALISSLIMLLGLIGLIVMQYMKKEDKA